MFHTKVQVNAAHTHVSFAKCTLVIQKRSRKIGVGVKHTLPEKSTLVSLYAQKQQSGCGPVLK